MKVVLRILGMLVACVEALGKTNKKAAATVAPAGPRLLLPVFKPVAVAMGVVAISTVLIVTLSIVVRMLGRFKLLLWPVAVGIAAVPFLLRDPLFAWWGGEYADAQLGLFLASSAFAWAAFRTIELSVGTVPDGADASLGEWITYVGSDIDPRYHAGKPVQPPPGKLANQCGKLLVVYLLMAAWVSVIEPFGYRPTATICDALGLPASLAPIVVRVGDNFFGTTLIYLFLWFLFTIGSITVLLQAHDPIDPMRNPVFGSRSPKEFWGKRWNLQVNSLLKKSVYKPLASIGLGGPVATLATFAASAAFHEYQFALSMKGYVVGTSCIFFLGQGILIIGQTIIEASPLGKPLTKLAAKVPLALAVVANISALSLVPDYFICNWIDLEMPLFGVVARIVPRVVMS